MDSRAEHNLHPEPKSAVRARMKQMRGGMPADAVREKSRLICERLRPLLEIDSVDEVLCYAAVRGEVDLKPLAEQIISSGKTAAFPRVRGEQMDFYAVSGPEELAPGAFGIPEPVPAARLLLPEATAVILIPGTAFMEDGSRIGMGKGYYDRYLSEYPDLYRIGVAYEAQLGAFWEPEEDDQPMDLIVTEERTISCRDLFW